MGSSELGVGVARAELLVDRGYLPLENGTTRRVSGVIPLAVLTKMPGVASAIFEWWIGWHDMENRRYPLCTTKLELRSRRS